MVPYRLSPREREREENAGKKRHDICTFTRIGTVYNPKYQSELSANLFGLFITGC